MKKLTIFFGGITLLTALIIWIAFATYMANEADTFFSLVAWVVAAIVVPVAVIFGIMLYNSDI